MLAVQLVKSYQFVLRSDILFGFPTHIQYTLAPIILISVIALLELMLPVLKPHLGFYPELIANGEYWRAITGQLLHTNTSHALLNSAGVALVWALHGEYYRTGHYALVLCSSLALVAVGLAVIYTETYYAGLSAVLHTLFVYGAVIDIQHKRLSGWLLLVGVWLKVGYENIYGAPESTAELIGATVAVEAHLIGAIVGVVLSFAYLWRQGRDKKAEQV